MSHERRIPVSTRLLAWMERRRIWNISAAASVIQIGFFESITVLMDSGPGRFS
jgi:hypothetical protein